MSIRRVPCVFKVAAMGACGDGGDRLRQQTSGTSLPSVDRTPLYAGGLRGSETHGLVICHVEE